MLHENDRSPPVVRAVDVAVRTDGSVWGEIEGHRRGVELAATHPDVDPTSIASMLPVCEDGAAGGNGSEPAAVLREIQQAARRGWIDCPSESSVFQGCNKLVAWVFSAGYITVGYTPYFAVRHGTDYERLDCAFARLRCGYELVNEGLVRRVRPDATPTALGRLLATLGAPVGPPTGRTTLPDYLADCPPSLRRAFVYTYLNNRALYPEGAVPVCERASPQFRRELTALLARTTREAAADGATVTFEIE